MGTGEAPVAGDPENDRRSAARVIGKVHGTVLGHGPAFDRTGETVAGTAAADPVHSAERDNLLFRWFVGLNMDEPVWVATVFTKNRDRLLEGEIASLFFAGVLAQARAADLLSDEHFSVDGTLIEAWAGQKSFQRQDASKKEPPDDPGNPTVNFHGERRRNETHESTTDADARLARKSGGQEAKLA